MSFDALQYTKCQECTQRGVLVVTGVPKHTLLKSFQSADSCPEHCGNVTLLDKLFCLMGRSWKDFS